MKLVISHVDRGGAYSVARKYADTLNARLLINPTFMELLSLPFRTIDGVVFHNVSLAFKFSIIFRVLRGNVMIYNVEHFVMTQIIKSEYSSPIRKWFFIARLKCLDFLGVVPITLDHYCKNNRRRTLQLNINAQVIYNPIIPPSNNATKLNKKYDFVWAGGLNDQKRWPEVLDLLECLSKTKRVIVTSYDLPTEEQMFFLESQGIDFKHNEPHWQSLADNFVFSSRYEGYPLVLIEAIYCRMNIYAWCNSSCLFQILNGYKATQYFPPHMAPRDIFELISLHPIDDNLNESYRLQVLERHNEGVVRLSILNLFPNSEDSLELNND